MPTYVMLDTACPLRAPNPTVLGLFTALLVISATYGRLQDDLNTTSRLLPGGFSRSLRRHWKDVRALFSIDSEGRLFDEKLEQDRATLEKLRLAGREARARQLGVTPGVTPRGTPPAHVMSCHVMSYPSPSERATQAAAKPPPAPRRARRVGDDLHSQIMATWKTNWDEFERHFSPDNPAAYRFTPMDARGAKTIRELGIPLQEVQERARTLIWTSDAFHAAHRSLAWLATRWNEVGSLPRAERLRDQSQGERAIERMERGSKTSMSQGELDLLASCSDVRQPVPPKLRLA